MATDELTTLERDFLDLAPRISRDAAFRRTLRAELARRAAPAAPSRIRSRPALAAAAAAALAIAAAIVVLGWSGAGGPEPAAAGVLDRAREALTPPPDTIAHVKLVGRGGIDHESWQLTSPPYSARWAGTLGGGPEVADDGTTQSVYDGKAGAIYTRPSPEPLRLSGPLAQIRADLAIGRARLAGTTAIAGARVYRAVLPHGFVAYLDPKTYRPSFIDYPTARGVVRMRVVALEYLPRTPRTVPLLSLAAQHPGARVEENPGAWSGK
jgi:hypothetical protein